MSKFYVRMDVPDELVGDLSKLAGVVEFLHTPDGVACEELVKTGNFHLSPYGFGEKDENGNVTKFELEGFSLSTGNGLE